MPPLRLKKILYSMCYRCHEPKSANYRNYGGRGISVCDEWKNNPETFFAWALANGYREDLTIERVNVNGSYEPANCTWIPKAEQSKNRRKAKSGRPKISPWSGAGVSPLRWCVMMFGGVSALASVVGITHSAVSGWRRTNRIPYLHHEIILASAKRMNIDVTAEDLISGRKF